MGFYFRTLFKHDWLWSIPNPQRKHGDLITDIVKDNKRSGTIALKAELMLETRIMLKGERHGLERLKVQYNNDVELEYHVSQLKAIILSEAQWNSNEGDVSKPKSFE
ncbi:hypothetical protein Tco_0193390 [Tanacetum coccineum]